jgi:hypothetical protein
MSVIVGRAAKGKKDRRDAAGVATYQQTRPLCRIRALTIQLERCRQRSFGLLTSLRMPLLGTPPTKS